MRTVVRTLIAVFLATAAPLLAAPAVRAHAQEVQQQSFRTNSAGSGRLTVSVDGVSPSYATPTATITVRGTVTNDTGSPVTGVQVQLLSSSLFFGTRSAMDSYTAGHDTLLNLAPAGTAVTLPGTLHSGRTAQWSASFPAASAGYPQFGVYPLAAQAENAVGSPLAISRTLLPYWPGSGAAKPLNVAWIWPLVDAPQQGMCGATLATNSLAGSLASGGRLGTLLDVGQQWAEQDHLTWVVDPALLSDVNVMRKGKYGVGGTSTCSDRHYEPASVAAAQWLSLLTGSTATEPMFAMPYADPDVAALTRAGLTQITRTGYSLAGSVTGQLLSRQLPTSVAWPADGSANASTLTSLARDGGVTTVVLNSGELPSDDGQYDDALNATTTGTGHRIGVLLADSGITGVLGSASASSPAGAQFAATQDFLADTAMILAEGPSLQRSIVVAPPRHWDPSAAEAGTLLSLTNSAPWLHSTDLSSLATAASQLSARAKLPRSQRGVATLSSVYTSQVAAVHASAATYKDLLYRPGPNVLDSVDAAVTATTSAAWRGAGAAGGWHALVNVGDNLNSKVKSVQIITGRKILLAGASGTTPVSVQNLLPVEVQVRVVATPSDHSQLTVSKFADLIQVPPGQTNTLRVPLHSSAITTTTMQLQLQTEDGSPLTGTSVSVQATRYGRALFVLIGGALGVLVLTAVARWIRRWLNDGRKSTNADGRSGGTG